MRANSTNPDGRTYAQVLEGAPTTTDLETLRVEGIACTFAVTCTFHTSDMLSADVWVTGGMGPSIWLARYDNQADAYADACNRSLETVAAETGEPNYARLTSAPCPVADTARLYRPEVV